LSGSLSYADSIGAIAVVRSISDLASSQSFPPLYWPSICTFYAMESNSHYEVINPSSIPSAIVTTTRGIIQAEGAYGDCLEFLGYLAGGNSGANGYVAGRLLRIYDIRNNGWEDARTAARAMAAYHNSWTKYTGYGLIDGIANSFSNHPAISAMNAQNSRHAVSQSSAVLLNTIKIEKLTY
jgi:hypothetical protein